MVEHTLTERPSQSHEILILPYLIKTHAQQTPNAIALTAPGRVPLTYGRLFKQVEAVADTLKTHGLGSQDRVAIVLPSGPEMAVAFLSVSCVCTSAPLPSSYPAKEVDFYFSDLCPKALLIQSGLDSPAKQVAHARDIPIIELSPNNEGPAGIFSIEGERPLCSLQQGNVTSDHVALVLYTSGTTSRPKMVPLTHVNICSSALNTATTLKLTEQDRCLNVMPLFHIHGLVGAFLSSLVSGGSVVCTSGRHGAEFFDCLKSFSPTWYTAVPTIHQEVLRWAQDYPTHIASHHLRFIRSSSSPLPTSVMQKLEDLFRVPVIEAYGMTEAAHQMTSNLLPPHSRKPGSVGKAAGPEVAIMDKVGNFLSPGIQGEIVIRGKNVMGGYGGNSVANDQAFTHQWFRTGDQGYVDTDGYFFITGRIKEIINRGGEKISPREVDDVLLEHPSVDQAVTYAIPHPTLGEEVAAAVVLRQDHSVTKKEIQRFLVNRLAGFKVPRRLNFVGEIPKGPTGKVNRIGLGDLITTQPNDVTVTPRNPVEAEVARIWENLLELDQVSINDDFFESGGDSLRGKQLIATLNQHFGKDLSWEILLQAPTVAELAKLLQEEHRSTSRSIYFASSENSFNVPQTSAWEIKRFYFRRSEKPLYGSYLKPSANVSRRCGIVLCYPMGQEYICSHRTFRQLAFGFSRVGFPVLRFDFTGCGDSEGDCDQWRIQQWKADIESSLIELKTRAEVKNVCLIGLRLGGTLARLVSAGREDVEGIVLWDPVINGMDYVMELIFQQQKHLVRSGGVPLNHTQKTVDQEVLGFTLTKNFLTDLQSINLLTVPQPLAKKILFIQSTEIAYGKNVEKQFRKSHPFVEFRHLPGYPAWMRGGIAQNIINTVVSWTAEVLR